MYSDDDLDEAVAAGVLDGRAVHAFRGFMAARQHGRLADEEHFRLLTGFNDIFVSIAVALVLTALIGLGAAVFAPLAGLLCAAASWGLAEYFTRKRRMALPSILLLLGFVGGVFAAVSIALVGVAELYLPKSLAKSPTMPVSDEQVMAVCFLAGAALAALGAWLHWRRFRVPVTVAAGALAVAGAGLSLMVALVPGVTDSLPVLTLLTGIALFVYAMRWDASDRDRITRRSDVAFWLHLVAAGMIVHPVFVLLPSVASPGVGVAMVLAVYGMLALVALIIDRRAVLVSALSYVLYSTVSAVLTHGGSSLDGAFGWALVALPIGSLLLMFSAFWHSVRRLVVGRLPSAIREKVPATAV